MSKANNYIAIDIGASSGRVIEYSIENKIIKEKELCRFKNDTKYDGTNHIWDIKYLYHEIVKGLKLATSPVSIGIDTWGVDYVCKSNTGFSKAVSYRDLSFQKHQSSFDKDELYQKTGIGKMIFNTIYQLESNKNQKGSFLMIPDYITYCLTNQVTCELTNAITTQMINYHTNDFDREILQKLSSDVKFKKPTQLLKFDISSKMKKELNYDCYVAQVATHDSASAFLGSYRPNESIVISLGTWSIVGCLIDHIINNKEAKDLNFSNEGSIEQKYRFQKNTMGTWMFENLKKELNDDSSYSHIIENINLIKEEIIVDVDDVVFLNPNSMKEAIDKYLINNGLEKPTNKFIYYKVIFDSMIFKYIEIINNIIRITKKTFKYINIVGGGCQNSYICQMLASKLNIKTVAGPIEATALGNLSCQLIVANEIEKHEDFKNYIDNSIDFKVYGG